MAGKFLPPQNRILWPERMVQQTKENWIEGEGDRVSVHFAVMFLDC